MRIKMKLIVIIAFFTLQYLDLHYCEKLHIVRNYPHNLNGSTDGMVADIPDEFPDKEDPNKPENEFTGTCRKELEIVLLLDHSGSIRYAKAWRDIQAFTRKIVDHVTIDEKDGARFCLITFDDTARIVFGLTQFKESKSIQAAINRIPRPGERHNTSMRAGLNLVGDALRDARTDARYIVILISDGLPKDASPSEIFKVGDAIKSGSLTRGKSVDIMTVGVTRALSRDDRESMDDLLTGLATRRNWRNSVDDFNKLGSVINEVIAETCPYPDYEPGDLTDCIFASDLTFIVDASGSIKESNPDDGSYDNWELIKNFLRIIVASLKIGPDNTQVAIIVYANKATVVTHLSEDNDKDSLFSTIKRLSHTNGNTNTSGAIRTMTRDVYKPNRGDRVGVPNVAVVITDGKSTYDVRDTVPAAEDARNQGIRMLAIGITNEVDPGELRNISSPPQVLGVTYWHTPTFETLNSVSNAARAQACRPLPDCRRADVAILLDNSGSIEYKGPENWKLALEFTQNVLRSSSISEDNTRVGLIKFATNPTLVWPMNRFYERSELMDQINRLSYQGGETEIGKALRLMRERMFTAQNGDRPDVPNIAILLTDGEDTSKSVNVSAEAKLARDAGIELFVVGITNKINVAQLQDIASDSDVNHVFMVEDYDRLVSILDDVVEDTCIEPNSTVKPVDPVDPVFPTAPPIPAPNPTGKCRIASDVMFVVDTSGSIPEKSLREAKDFMKLVIADLEIDAAGGSKFGIVSFSDNAEVFVPLGRYNSLDAANKRIDQLSAKGGKTNTPEALKLLYERVFNGQGEDRLIAPNIAIMITDGGTDNNLKAQTFEEAIKAKSSGIHLIVFGVGRWLVRSTLTAIASYPPEINMFEVPSYTDLTDYKDTLVKFICNTDNECVSNPCRNGGSCFDGIAVYTCFCNEGYGGVNCENNCREPGDLTFTLDASGSITEQNFYRLLNFLKALVTDLPVGSGMNVGLQTFSDDVQVYFNLNDYQAKIQYLNVMTLPYFNNGRTNTAEALRNLRNMYSPANGDRPNYPNIAIITTDGRSNDRTATWNEAMALRRTGASVITIGLGNSVSEKELRDMASFPTDANIYSVSSFTELDSIRTSLVDSICNRVDDCSSNPCQNGGSCIDLRGGYECICPDTATGINCERVCSGVMDVVFVVDISGSIRRERFNDVIEQMIDIVNSLEITNDKTRVGAIAFDENVRVEFPLGHFSSKTDIIQAFRFIKYSGGLTNIASALKLLREQMFAPDFGSRNGVPHIAVAFTDGTQTVDQYNLVDEAIQTKLAGIHVITVSVGSDTNLYAIQAIASEPIEANVFRARLFSGLPEVIAKIPAATCNEVNECLQSPCMNGGRCVDLLGTYTCECMPNFAGTECQRACPVQKDIALLLDIADGRANIDPWRKAFIRTFLSGLDIESGNVRISSAVYGARTKILYDFNEFQSSLQAIIATSYSRDNSWTNAVEALTAVRSTMFRPSSGDRPDVPNALVILTDGGSRDRSTAIQIARELVAQGVEIYVVALGYHTNLAEVSQLATRPDLPYVIQFNSATAAGIAAGTILDGLCRS